jgi:hypothetical protein
MWLPSCTTDATVELTKAPFDATSALSDGTSQAIGELLEPTSEFTSSTTPGASAGDPLLRARQRTIIFTVHSYDNLRSDVARGGGEYLISLATLAGVPKARHEEFRHTMRNGYSTMFQDTLTSVESSTRIVDAAWAMGHGHVP